ncbi:hypothetical protein GGP55_002775 [Salinibacter ruber]|uniref:hypothetical protein n=1 Tax=Salinibacter ruber TaxID=146919 RepID=UPI002168217E|nr:hypothetical protein [Salinibacter ruber]MCS3632162.1 hypothetical protein [Salinibacter ruber]
MIDALPADALRTRFDPSGFGFETTDDLPAETEVVGQDRAVEEADLVALGKTSTQSSRRRLGTTSEALPAESSAPVLVLRRAPRRCPPPSAYYDGSETAQQALRTAAGGSS